jgi:hypothetical protein
LERNTTEPQLYLSIRGVDKAVPRHGDLLLPRIELCSGMAVQMFDRVSMMAGARDLDANHGLDLASGLPWFRVSS